MPRTLDTATPPSIRTLAELRASGWKSRPVKSELRDNLLTMSPDMPAARRVG